MDIIQKIIQAVEPSLSALGYQLVLVKLADGGRRKTLSVMAERADDQGMSFDDCTQISRVMSALLDVEDPITGAYDLEVCSPGLDRPLTREADYVRFAGQEVKLETLFPIEGRKRFRGVIKGIVKDVITLAMPEGEAKIPFGQVRNAKLIPASVAGPVKKPGKKKNKG